MNYRPCSYCQQSNLENPLRLKSKGNFIRGNKEFERSEFYCRECGTTETVTTDYNKLKR